MSNTRAARRVLLLLAAASSSQTITQASSTLYNGERTKEAAFSSCSNELTLFKKDMLLDPKRSITKNGYSCMFNWYQGQVASHAISKTIIERGLFLMISLENWNNNNSNKRVELLGKFSVLRLVLARFWHIVDHWEFPSSYSQEIRSPKEGACQVETQTIVNSCGHFISNGTVLSLSFS